VNMPKVKHVNMFLRVAQECTHAFVQNDMFTFLRARDTM